MIFPVCVVCGSPSVQQHHFIPSSLGGSDEATNLISLCEAHHGQMHELRIATTHKALVMAGIEDAKKAGVRIGPKPPSMMEFGDSAGTRSAQEDVWVQLYAEDGINQSDMVNLTWGDIATPVVQLPYRKVKLSERTQAAVRRAMSSMNMTGADLSKRVVVQKDGSRASAVYLAKRIFRLKNGPSAMKKHPKLPRPACDLPKALPKPRRILVSSELRTKYGHDQAHMIATGALLEKDAIPYAVNSRVKLKALHINVY